MDGVYGVHESKVANFLFVCSSDDPRLLVCMSTDAPPPLHPCKVGFFFWYCFGAAVNLLPRGTGGGYRRGISRELKRPPSKELTPPPPRPDYQYWPDVGDTHHHTS